MKENDPTPPPSAHSTGVTGARLDPVVERARQGEAAAYRELFRTHVGRVRTMLFRLLGRGAADLDDLTQTVFVECFRSLPGFRGDALFRTWLAKITVRVAMHAMRRPPVTLIFGEGEEVEGSDDPARAHEHREALERVTRLLEGLKPRQRSVFVLHVLEGYSVKETAQLVGRAEITVKLRLRAARKIIERRARKDAVLSEYFHD